MKNLHLNFILPSHDSGRCRLPAAARHEETEDAAAAPERIALFLHLYFPDLFAEMAQYARSMPADADIYITTSSEEKRQLIIRQFSGITRGRLEVRVTPNRGRDVASLLVGLRDVVPQYDLVCFVHDKKSGQVRPASIGESFAWKCLNNMLASPDYVRNIISLFQQNPRLGLLVPPEPNHSYYFFSLGDEWSLNFDNTRILARKMGLTVPIAPDHRPLAPLGSYIWFRTTALASHFASPLDYSDFPEEPLPEDGALSHALERIYPFVAQQAGFFTAVVMADDLARLEYTNLRHYVARYNQSGFDFAIRGPFTLMNAIYHQKFYDAPKWVGIAGERLDHIERLTDEYHKLQALYENTLDVRFRRLIKRLLPGKIRKISLRTGKGRNHNR